jgi:hypothetical protein
VPPNPETLSFHGSGAADRGVICGVAGWAFVSPLVNSGPLSGHRAGYIMLVLSRKPANMIYDIHVIAK